MHLAYQQGTPTGPEQHTVNNLYTHGGRPARRAAARLHSERPRTALSGVGHRSVPKASGTLR